ncbi:hypothetical protein A9Q86_11705 [Flavobacteriales bacterium 33_180_T64]|nr:hypothetical protein A9Q86_11705 [Flavobacteriales bacterium 33_180_T64]
MDRKWISFFVACHDYGKNGFTEFAVIDNTSGKQWKEYPIKRLTVIQEKQMSFQTDMIWQYAQYLKDIYNENEFSDIAIYTISKVSLNGKTSQTFIDPKMNLLELINVDDVYNFVLESKQ